MTMHWMLTPSELENIAKITVESAVLESNLDFWLHRILRIKESEYRSLIGGATIGSKIRMFGEIVEPRLKAKNRITALRNGLKKMNQLIPERNIVVHGKWNAAGAVTPVGALEAAFGPRQAWDLVAKSAKNKTAIPLSRLPALAAELTDLNNELTIFCSQVFAVPRQRSKRKAAKSK